MDFFEEYPGLIEFPDIGSYPVTYTVTDDYGFEAGYQTIVEVHKNLAPSAPVLLAVCRADILYDPDKF